MRVCFVIPESIRSYSFIQPPLGLLRAAAILRQCAGDDVRIVDNRIEQLPIPELLRRLDALQPDVVFTLTNTYDQSQVYMLGARFNRAVATINAIASSGYLVVTCGPHGTVNPHLFSQTVKCAVIVRGEFDEGILAIRDRCKELATNHSLLSASTPIIIDAIPGSGDEYSSLFPAYDLIPMHRYYGDRIASNVAVRRIAWSAIFGVRGCPFACSYCYLFFGRTLRRRAPRSVVDELRHVHHCYGVSGIWFLDYTFTADRDWAIELCRHLAHESLDIEWVCQTRADLIDPGVLASMKKAGCKAIWLGIETFGDSALALAGKHISRQTVLSAVEATRRFGIQPVAYLMFGLPGETADSLLDTLRWLIELQLEYLDGIELATPRPGTALCNRFSPAFPRLLTTWDYPDIVAGLLGNDLTPKMLLSVLMWLGNRRAILDNHPLPCLAIDPKDLDRKAALLEMGR